MSQRQRVHSPPSHTYYGTHVPCSPYTHPEYHALQLTTGDTAPAPICKRGRGLSQYLMGVFGNVNKQYT